jgi:hypothetical protein
VVVLDDVLYAIGGYDNGGVHSSVEVLRTRTNDPPVADAGADQALECVAGGALASLDGSGSSDADGAIVSYEWSQAGVVFATTESVDRQLALGVHDFTLTVTDNDWASASDVVTVDVSDSQAPVIEANVHRTSLWPPNHAMIHVATVAAGDACDGAADLRVEVASNQPDNGLGDGDTSPDWKVESNPDGSLSVFVRAERAGNSRRTYTIAVTATDQSTNSSTQVLTVTVSR